MKKKGNNTETPNFNIKFKEKFLNLNETLAEQRIKPMIDKLEFIPKAKGGEITCENFRISPDLF